MELENVIPDIVTLAKAQTNGSVTMGTMVTTEKIANKTLGKNNLTSTLGWSPIACAAALKTLEIHQREQVWKKAEKDGKYILNLLTKKLKSNPKVIEVRGKGMEIGLELKDNRTAQLVVKKAFEKGLHLIVGDGGNIQIMPPLIIKRELLDEGLNILLKVIDSVV